MPVGLNFAVLDSATGNVKKVADYISVGMDSTVDIAQDVMDTEKENGKSKMKELQSIMLEYAEMEHDLEQFLDAVEFVKAQAKSADRKESLEELLDAKLAEIQQTNPKPCFQSHVKYQEMLEKIQDQAGDEEPTAASSSVPATQIDEDLAMTQAEPNIKCPYTGQPMKNPVRNKHCSHNYDRDGITALINNRKGRAKCPVGGCPNTKVVEMSDLEENKELKRYIEKKNRQEGKRPRKGAVVVT